MPWKTILAHLPDEKRAPAILAVGLQLADRFDAHLIALHVVPQPYVPIAPYGDAAGEVMERERETLEAEAQRIKAKFAAMIAGRAVIPEYRQAQARFMPVAEVVTAHARCADLVVAGQPETGLRLDYRPGDVGEDVMMEAGRPVLLVPETCSRTTLGERVLLAWNGSREASRAAFDALPMLAGAREVRILTINPAKRLDEKPDDSGRELATALGRHGVNAIAAWSLAHSHGIAEELASRIGDPGADLLVMGGYGHSRFREFLFGGVTAGMLSRMRIPVLMSH